MTWADHYRIIFSSFFCSGQGRNVEHDPARRKVRLRFQGVNVLTPFLFVADKQAK